MPKVTDKTAEKKVMKKTVGRFRVVQGSHHEGGKHYKKGDVVESASDLLKHNSYGSTKFVSVDDVVVNSPEPETDDDNSAAFEEMSMTELRQWAEEGDINLEGCTTKKQIVERLTTTE